MNRPDGARIGLRSLAPLVAAAYKPGWAASQPKSAMPSRWDKEIPACHVGSSTIRHRNVMRSLGKSIFTGQTSLQAPQRVLAKGSALVSRGGRN
jgi:hypothetical protein